MRAILSPYELHVGEWVYGHHEEDGETRQTDDKHHPVCIMSINNETIVTTDGETYDFRHLSPIPLNQETVGLFDWSKTGEVISLHRNWQTEKPFFRYALGSSRMREKHGLATMHEAQQWFFQTFGKPLCLALVAQETNDGVLYYNVERYLEEDDLWMGCAAFPTWVKANAWMQNEQRNLPYKYRITPCRKN